jgi:Uma2 family endonuclease
MVRPKPWIKFTAKDYMSAPEDKRYQLLDGEMILAPSPTSRHQTISAALFAALRQFIASHNLGRVWYALLDVVLSDHDVAQPDILFVSNARSAIITEANIQGGPDLVVEILSPSSEQYDRGYKQALYGRHGVREYWIVDPESETVDVLCESEQGLVTAATYGATDTLVSPLLEGLSIELGPVLQQSY